jgi:hypothetical protein
MRVMPIFVLAVAIPLVSCDPGDPVISEADSELGLVVDHNAGATDAIAHEIALYGGAQTQAMRVTLKISELPLDARVIVGNGHGGIVQEITADGETTTNWFDGNVARVKIELEENAARPRVEVVRLGLRRTSTFIAPVVEANLADNVRAFPLRAGKTVDIAFGGRTESYFFSFTAPNDGVYDIGYFGSGRLRMHHVNETSFPLNETLVRDSVPRTNSTVSFARYNLAAGDELLMGATNDGAPTTTGRARVVVMEATGDGKLAFPSLSPLSFVAWGIGVDHNTAAGARGLLPGKELDCTTHDGTMGVWDPTGTGNWVEVLGYPRCYDSHEGTDWMLALGPAGQLMNTPVSAAIGGFVIDVMAGNPDKCFANPFNSFKITCGDFSGGPAPADNYVLVRHDDGLLGYYVHGRRNASVVVPGQRVACGELLTPAASAGNSSGPHLHFELQQIRQIMVTNSDSMFTATDIGSVRAKTDWVDPFGPVNRWRTGGDIIPEPDCG